MTVVSATSITATTPAGTAGARDVAVTTPGGSGTGTGLFTYIAAPTVTSIAPTSGPAASGTPVTITGTNFTGATAVTIGGAAATGVTVVSATSITATTPVGTAGARDVAVTTPGGTGTGTGLFTYIAAPTVTGISPSSGPVAGGTGVTITGTNFTGATAVTIGGAAATGVTVVSATSITATTPAGTAGARDVAVTAPGGTGTGTGLFAYIAAPTVTAISPTSGPATGGTSVTISGTNFTGATAVTIGGAAATAVTVVSATSITATTPAGTAGARDVAVTTPGGSGTGTGLFTYSASPTAITSAGATTNIPPAAVAIDTALTVTDADSTTLASATVSISGNFQAGQDVLAFTNNPATMGNINATYNAATGVLTLISAGASATIGQWQTALRSVTYANSAVVPSISTRAISFVVNDGTSSSAVVGKTLTVSSPAPTDPTLPGLPHIPGVSGMPSILNMSGSDGPSLIAGLTQVLSAAVGANLYHIGQSPSGTMVMGGFNGAQLAIAPLSMQTGDTRPNGVYPQGNGQYQIIFNGTAVTVVPALVSLNQLAGLLPTGATLSMEINGVLTATNEGITYIIQPGIVALPVDNRGGRPLLGVGSDSHLHFIDHSGNSQILYPAFLEPDTLLNYLRIVDSGAALSVQLDGTAAIRLNGRNYTIVPDITLGGIPSEHGSDPWWLNGPNHITFQNWRHPGTSQGFGVIAR